MDNRTGRLQVFIRHTEMFHVEHYHGHGKFREIVSRETIDNKFYKCGVCILIANLSTQGQFALGKRIVLSNPDGFEGKF